MPAQTKQQTQKHTHFFPLQLLLASLIAATTSSVECTWMMCFDWQKRGIMAPSTCNAQQDRGGPADQQQGGCLVQQDRPQDKGEVSVRLDNGLGLAEAGDHGTFNLQTIRGTNMLLIWQYGQDDTWMTWQHGKHCDGHARKASK